ncbi:sulfite exporter TauE/SafE family protein [Arthrobacter sp. NEB 688]|uniref:sulfite exporter TauE/SafE family protein n=1 Tax=Arthrobacter sp. NEB 688 TaxID=904039 RepID=UPI001C20ABAC|nr:sulfite exporter TauE/SafE family protein [Arthrobacter sp. NEB 688]
MLDALFTTDALAVLVVALGVGVVVGLTGMGGGALMTPALVFLGIPPTAAVANDLVAAAINKSIGAAVHTRQGSPDLRLAGMLVVGSVPSALVGAWLVGQLGSGEEAQETLRLAIGVTLLFTAATYTARVYGTTFLDWGGRSDSGRTAKLVPTIIVGAVGGFLVGLTSVGSGSIIMISLLLLNPGMSVKRLVGTDLVQAVPLVIAAAIGHVVVTGVDWSVLVPLVVGGAPGTFVGARLAARVPSQAVRRGIVIVLTLTGLSLLRVPPQGVGAAGAALLVLGPLAWALLRVGHGMPAFRGSGSSSPDIQTSPLPGDDPPPGRPDHPSDEKSTR